MGRWKGSLFDAVWLLFWIVASSIWCISASARLGATFDEPTYINLGLEGWRTGSYKPLIDLGTMPLPATAQTLPLYLWERHLGQPFDVTRDLERILPIARLGTLPFWWILLVYAWISARQIGGAWAGRIGLMFLACDPNLLAHASLATTDIAVTGCFLALLYHFRIGRDRSWTLRVCLPAFWFALVILSKASGFVFGILGMIAIELEYRWSNSTVEARLLRLRILSKQLFLKPFRNDFSQIFWLGLLGAFCFCGSEWQSSPSFVEWARKLPDGVGRSAMVWFAEHLRIFSNAGVALVRQVRHNIQGHGVFILGHVAKRAIWYYFPLMLAIKCPLPLLSLPFLVGIGSRRALRNWACAVAVTLLGFTLICRVQTGIRLVLPLVAIAVVGLSSALVIAWQQTVRVRRRWVLRAGSGLCAAWLLWSSVSVWPDGLCFTNELWGGTENGYRCLSDSNYDWGQGLKELAQWQEAHQARDLDVLYYGTDSTLARLPMHSLVASSIRLGPDKLPDESRGRLLAVGTTILYGSLGEIFPDLSLLSQALRELRPVDRTTTFFIYRLPSKEMAKHGREETHP
jgi:hypothetical protein